MSEGREPPHSPGSQSDCPPVEQPVIPRRRRVSRFVAVLLALAAIMLVLVAFGIGASRFLQRAFR